jgi:hypothetical protein
VRPRRSLQRAADSLVHLVGREDTEFLGGCAVRSSMPGAASYFIYIRQLRLSLMRCQSGFHCYIAASVLFPRGHHIVTRGPRTPSKMGQDA